MRILVVEDKEMHQKSAEETLSGHELTIAKSFDEAMNLIQEGMPFEVVLADMMMPMSEQVLEPKAFKAGEQVPYGFVVSLKAALCGAKFVAMITDTNHHKGAISAALDHIGRAYYPEEGLSPNFNINGARVMFVHTPHVEAQVSCSVCNGQNPKCWRCEGSGIAREFTEQKDWGKVFKDLTSEIEKPKKKCVWEEGYEG